MPPLNVGPHSADYRRFVFRASCPLGVFLCFLRENKCTEHAADHRGGAAAALKSRNLLVVLTLEAREGLLQRLI